VRRAVSSAINRKRVIDVALNGFGVAADGAIPPSHPYHGAAVTPDDAAALLDSTGWKKTGEWRTRNGERLRFTLRTVGNGDNAIEQLVQADLRALGIDVEISQMELGAFLAMARASEKDFDAIITGIPGDVSMSHVSSMFEGSQAGGALDYAGFHRPALDTLFARARRAASEPQLAAAWQAERAPGWESAPAVRAVHPVRRAASHCPMGLARQACGLRRRAAGGNRADASTMARGWSYFAQARDPCPPATTQARSAATTPQCFPAPSSCLSFCFRDPVP
jgi:ABC-type transport system substrate-binding protein